MTRAPSTPPDLPGLDYVRLLGSGGFSDVFLYDQRLPRRQVAVKALLADGLDESAREAFVDEANRMAQLSAHPYIVTIFHADVSVDNRPYFVMEYCSGPSLSEQYKREPFAVADALRTGIRLASAIATAHGAGILHRDIKPANVLTNDYGWPAVTDFGISSAVEDELPQHATTTLSELREVTGNTESQSVGLSVPWSPPEMFEDAPRPDVRSDIFSLAATIWTLLAGRTPFEIPGRPNGPLDLMGRIERGAITPFTRTDIPRSLIAVLQKGMASQRSDRYATSVDLARALQRVELELGYAPTSIEVPNLVVRETVRDSSGDNGDETRVRTVATIDAQPTLAPPASVPAPIVPPDETRLRQVTTVEQEAPDTATVLRPRVASTEASSIVPAEPMPAADPADEPPPRRRKPVAAAIAVAAVVVVVVVVALSLVLGGKPAPKHTSTASGGGGESAIVQDEIPTPVLVSTKPINGNASVVFTWTNPSAKKGDTFRWAPAEQPGETRPTSQPTVTVKRPSPGVRVCIQVVVQRDGHLSPTPLEACDPK